MSMRVASKKTYRPDDLLKVVDGHRFERRRVEFFADGRVLWTSPETWAGAQTSTTPLPPFEELADDPECEPSMVTQEEFERVWALRDPQQRA